MSRAWPFVAGRKGVVVNLAADEQEVLASLIGDLRQLLMADSHDTLRRLKPPAHPGDEEAEAAYRRMVGDELLRGRLELLDVLDTGIGGAVLDDAGVAAWMQGLNMIRLVLGERLELEGADLAAHELPEGPATFLYEWTGELLEFLVRATSAR